MANSQQHYDQLLAPIYLWMTGGPAVALRAGAADLGDLLNLPPGLAVDLGAGFGAHAIPLARAGWQVIAIDSSRLLLEQLRSLAGDLSIETRVGDLLSADTFAPAHHADLVLCMGDTLTHLPDESCVTALAASVARILRAGGPFLATFRDYTQLPREEARFIPVRSDATRIHTCFLEEAGSRVRVYDVVHEQRDGTWSTHVSSYPKLRLSPERVSGAFSAAGLATHVSPGPRGMVRLTSAHAGEPLVAPRS